MFKTKKLTLGEFAKEKDLSVSQIYSTHLTVFPINMCKLEIEEPFVLISALKPFIDEPENKIIAKKRFISDCEVHLNNLEERVADLKVNQFKKLFYSKYRKIVKEVNENIEKIKASLAPESIDKVFEDLYEKNKDYLEQEITVVDQPYKIGDKLYAVFLGGISSFDRINQSKLVKIKEYTIKDLRIDSRIRKDQDQDPDSLSLDVIMKIKQEDNTATNYPEVNIKFVRNKDGNYELSSGYSNLKVFESQVQAQKEAKDIVQTLKYQLDQLY